MNKLKDVFSVLIIQTHCSQTIDGINSWFFSILVWKKGKIFFTVLPVSFGTDVRHWQVIAHKEEMVWSEELVGQQCWGRLCVEGFYCAWFEQWRTLRVILVWITGICSVDLSEQIKRKIKEYRIKTINMVLILQ